MTKIKLRFIVYGDDWNPIELTKLIDLIPTDYWIKDEIIEKYLPNIVKRKETGWEYDFGTIQSLYLEEITGEFVRLFQSRIDKISSFMVSNNLFSKLFVVPEIASNEVPALFFDREILNMLYQLRTEIDIDLYILDDK